MTVDELKAELLSCSKFDEFARQMLEYVELLEEQNRKLDSENQHLAMYHQEDQNVTDAYKRGHAEGLRMAGIDITWNGERCEREPDCS